MMKNPLYMYGTKNVPVPSDLNFGSFILERIWNFRERVALIDGATNETITYKEIAQQAMNFAVSLSRMGVKKDDVIALFSENRIEYWGVVVGVACVGGILTTISSAYVEGEIKHVMNISKPKYMIISPLMYKTHEKLLKSFGSIRKFIVFGNDRYANTLSYDTMAITNSRPFSHDPGEVTLTITPWYHAIGLVGLLIGLASGRTGVYLAKFDVDLYLRIIEKYKAAQLTVVPPVLVAVCKHQNKYDLSSVKIIYSGGAPLHKDTIEDVTKRFPNMRAVLQGYGASEATLALTTFNYNNFDMSKIGCVGLAVPGTVIKVVDPDTRKPLGPNEQGEICAKGEVLMKGYVGKSRNDDFDDEDFYMTGDLGYYDEQGQFFITGRLKELIKYKGFQVPPAELEAVLLQHPSVKDVGVVGVEHGTAGEVPLAFVVLQPGHTATEQELKDFVAQHLSNPKHLRGGVHFIEEIPKTQSGKILRRELKKLSKTQKSKLGSRVEKK